MKRQAWVAGMTAAPLAIGTRSPLDAAGMGPVSDPGLIARAQAEKTMLLYAAMNGDDLAKMAAAFSAQYQIECRTLRLPSNGIAPRLSIEHRGGQYAADVTLTTGYDCEIIKRSNLLVPYTVPETNAFSPGFVDPEHYWASCLTSTTCLMYNTARLKAANLPPPSTWADFTRPEWRGKFAIFSGSVNWYIGLRRGLGRAVADPLVRAIGANQPNVTATRQQATSLTASGEYLAALAVYGKEAVLQKATGQPVELVNAPPTVAESTGIGIVKDAPHPNAARLFIRWLFSRETQQNLISGTFGHVSPRKDVTSNPALWNPHMRIVVLGPSDAQTYDDDVKTFNTWFGIPT